MESPQTTHPLLRIARDVILVDIFIFMSLGFVYMLAGWSTIHQYASGLVWTGALGMILLLISAGWGNGRREETAALSQLMREHEVFYLLNRDNSARGRILLVGAIALAVSFVVGWILIIRFP